MPENPYQPPKEVNEPRRDKPFTLQEFVIRSIVAVLLIVAIYVVLGWFYYVRF